MSTAETETPTAPAAETPKKSAAKKSAGKSAAKSAPKAERQSTNQFKGGTLVMTEKGKTARRAESGRRTRSWNVLKDNANKAGRLSYEEYIAKGGRHDDLATIVRLGHAEVVKK